MTHHGAAPDPRVLLVTPWPPPEGGMAVQARGLAAALAAGGTPVAVVPTNVPLGWISRVPLIRGVLNLGVYLFRLLAALFRSDVVHILACSGLSFFLFTMPAVVLGRLLGRRVVVNYRGGLAESFLEERGAWVLPVLRRCHRLVVPSGYLEAVFVRFGLEPEVVPNFVDLDRFSAPTRGGGSRILVTRNLEPMYGIDTALDAFQHVRRRVPDAELILAGTGSRKSALEKRVEREGIPGVTFLGRVEAEAIPALYARAHVALNPSRVDNMPISVLEAFAAGVPVVSTRAGGVPHLVTDNVNGLLAGVGDARGLAARILRCLRRPDLVQGLARAGRASAASFSLEAVQKIWQSIYRQEAGLVEKR